MSRTCPGHVRVPGTCPQIERTELNGRPCFGHFLLSHVSATWPCVQSRVLNKNQKIKKVANHPKIFRSDRWNFWLIPLLNLFSSNSKFGIAPSVLIPEWKKWGVKKRFASRTQKLHRDAPLIPPPPCFPLIPAKMKNFSFFHFLNKSKLIKLNWGNPHDLRSSLHNY